MESFFDVLPAAGAYRLSDVELDLSGPSVAVFRAMLKGPEGAAVWARAWLSNETETLAEAASGELKAGDSVTLTVVLRGGEAPETAYMRIESAPLVTEHVVGLRLGGEG